MGEDGTPWVGIIERVDIGAFLAWVAMLAIALLRAPGRAEVTATDGGAHRSV